MGFIGDNRGIYRIDRENPKFSICQICGKRIYRFGHGGMAMTSHAKKHVKEGKTKIIEVHSTRCYSGVDYWFEPI